MTGDAGTAAAICGIGMITAIGGNALQTLASFRAGINRYAEGPVHNRRLEPMTMALVPNSVLPPLKDEVGSQASLTGRQTRMLRLATPAVIEAMKSYDGSGPIPLLLAVPESLRGRRLAVPDNFVDLLSAQTGVATDPASSRLFRTGRAGGLQALSEALRLIRSGSHEHVLVGGVDSYLDLYLLATLDMENRILGDGVMDGFAPGEGSGFLLLSAHNARASRPVAFAHAPGLADEPGYRYSKQPYKGDGLANAIRDAVDGNDSGPIRTVFCSANGESFGTKEWGVAASRNATALSADFRFEHPADCFGDTGAAVGPILLGLAAIALRARSLPDPALVWCASDGRHRAAVRLTLH